MIPGGCTRVFTRFQKERDKSRRNRNAEPDIKNNNENTPPPPTNRLHPPFCGGMPLCRTRQPPVTKINIIQYTHLTTQYTGQLKHFV